MGFYDYEGNWHEDDQDMPGVLQKANPETSVNPDYKSVEWWLTQGVPNEDIFDPSTGQLKPGWARTGNGYERVPVTGGGTSVGGTNTGGAILPPGTIGSLLQPFPTPPPSYVNPGPYQGADIGPAPEFPTLPGFTSPTPEEAAQLPGYDFARREGLRGLEQSAAARGVTNTGGTLQDIIKYGDQFAAQNYQTARANKLEDYGTNIASQYLLPYQAKYDAWATKGGFDTSAAAGRNSYNLGSASNQNNFNRGTWQDLYSAWRNRNLDSFNGLYSLASLGANVS